MPGDTPGRPGVGERLAPCSLKPLPLGKEWGGGGGHSSNCDTCARSGRMCPDMRSRARGRPTPGPQCRPRRPSGGRPAPPRLPPPALAPPLTQSVGSQFRSPVRLSAGGAAQGGALPASSPASGADGQAAGEAPRPAPRARAHRPGDVVEDPVGGGVPARSGLRAERAGRLPRAVLSGDKGRGAHSLAPEAAGRRRRDPGAGPLTCDPSARASWRRRPAASEEPGGCSGCSPWAAAADPSGAGRRVRVPHS